MENMDLPDSSVRDESEYQKLAEKQHSLDVTTDGDNSTDNFHLPDSSVKDEDLEHQDLEKLKSKMAELENELQRVKQQREEIEKLQEISSTTESSNSSFSFTEEDSRSIYVGNVDSQASTEELQQHFQACGVIKRVTIPSYVVTGTPKGYAFIEFWDQQSATISMDLNDSVFKGRKIKVMQKRTNLPRINPLSHQTWAKYVRGRFLPIRHPRFKSQTYISHRYSRQGDLRKTVSPPGVNRLKSFFSSSQSRFMNRSYAYEDTNC